MKLNKDKQGISLIVLVITIVVMIILAAAIILSLNSSNISGKASEARLSNDLANKKEAASVYLAEYEIKLAKGKLDKNTTSPDKYVKTELKKVGIDISDVAVTGDGTILVGIAALFVNNNVEIGTEVVGYKVVEKSYTTSGKENTCSTSNTETNPQSSTIKGDESITWKYIGIDENGQALIVGSVTDNSSKMILGGKGGYLYGPQELNKACNVMYSSRMGIARSINMDDVTRVLEYTGEKGSYKDIITSSYTPILKERTINEIAKEIGYDLNNFSKNTPEEGRTIETYKADYYTIFKGSEEDKKQYNSNNTDAVNLIYPGNDTTNPKLAASYWLSSACTFPYFNENYANFRVRYVCSTQVDAFAVYSSKGTSYNHEYAIRPVVTLNPSVQMTYSNGVVTLK